LKKKILEQKKNASAGSEPARSLFEKERTRACGMAQNFFNSLEKEKSFPVEPALCAEPRIWSFDSIAEPYRSFQYGESQAANCRADEK